MQRPLSPDDDASWLSLFEVGPEPWAQEVERFLRSEAIVRQEHGDCKTTVFLLPDKEQLVGFLSVTSKDLDVDPAFRKIFGFSSRKSPRSPVGAIYLCAIGTDVRHRGKNYATEMHEALVESVTSSMLSPRFVLLQVWEDSPAVRLYLRWGYRVLSTTPYDRDGTQVGKHKMVLDRFTALASGSG